MMKVVQALLALLLIIALAGLLPQYGVWADDDEGEWDDCYGVGDFSFTCTNVELFSQGGLQLLTAMCGTGSHDGADQTRRATIDLDDKVGVGVGVDGWLQCKTCRHLPFDFYFLEKQCSFSQRCSAIHLIDSHILGATCTAADGTTLVTSGLDLNQCIVNHYGTLDWVCRPIPEYPCATALQQAPGNSSLNIKCSPPHCCTPPSSVIKGGRRA